MKSPPTHTHRLLPPALRYVTVTGRARFVHSRSRHGFCGGSRRLYSYCCKVVKPVPRPPSLLAWGVFRVQAVQLGATSSPHTPFVSTVVGTHDSSPSTPFWIGENFTAKGRFYSVHGVLVLNSVRVPRRYIFLYAPDSTPPQVNRLACPFFTYLRCFVFFFCTYI